jgi:hypothetical protein
MQQLKAMLKYNINDPAIVTDCNDRLRQLHTRLTRLQQNLHRATSGMR